MIIFYYDMRTLFYSILLYSILLYYTILYYITLYCDLFGPYIVVKKGPWRFYRLALHTQAKKLARVNMREFLSCFDVMQLLTQLHSGVCPSVSVTGALCNISSLS